MAHLTLAGLSDDGKRLLLVSDKGVEFTLDIDARLRAALRGDTARLGHLEIQMDSTLRPRDIQARIRSGDTPEAVAQAAQTTVDRIMAFAAPVLAERQHVAERAQRSSVRRKPGETSGARTLGDAVAGHLRSLNVDPDTVAWDARRREDGRWTLTGDYAAGKHQGSATFIFDPPGNYVTVEDEDARWLLGEQVAETQRPARDDLKQARGRRLSAVSESTHPRRAAAGFDGAGFIDIGRRRHRDGQRGVGQPGRGAAGRGLPRRRAAHPGDAGRRGAVRRTGGRVPSPSRSRPPRRSRPAARCRRRRDARRSRAGTRSCSAAARTTDDGQPPTNWWPQRAGRATATGVSDQMVHCGPHTNGAPSQPRCWSRRPIRPAVRHGRSKTWPHPRRTVRLPSTAASRSRSRSRSR